MNDRARVVLASLGGALAGGLLGYFYLTDRGREIRGELEPALEDLVTGLKDFGGSVARATEVAGERLRSLASMADAATRPPDEA
jgi:hypothetical protein